MRILLFNWRDPKNPLAGGAEIVTLEHAKSWIKKGNSVTWFASSFPHAKDRELLNGITLIRQGNSISVFFHAVLYYLKHRNEFDLLIDEIHGIPFFTPLYSRKPKIAFIHEVAQEIWDYMYPFPISFLGKFLEKILLFPYRYTDFITVSNSTRQELVKLGINQDHIHIIMNGLQTKFSSFLQKKTDPLTFIFVSRIVKMKGIEEILKSFGLIKRAKKDARLWIVGKGEDGYIQKLKRMAKEYGILSNITFFNNTSDKEKLSLMKKAHLLLHASVKEGWGLVIVEAASRGTPSVVYNVPGLRDSVQNNKTGIVLSVNSPDEMAREALSLVANKKRYERMQQQGIAWTRTLSWEEATKQSEKLLERMNGK